MLAHEWLVALLFLGVLAVCSAGLLGFYWLYVATPGERMLQRAERRGDWTPPVTEPAQKSFPDPGALGKAKSGGEFQVYEIPGRPYDASGSEAPTSAAPQGDAGEGWAARDDLAGPYVKVNKTYVVRALPDGFEIVDQDDLCFYWRRVT